MNDLRFAFRQLLKNPGFTAVAVLTLALGIGANTSMFTMLNALLLRSLPYPDADRLVRVFRTSPQSQAWPYSAADFLDQREQNNIFDHMAAFSWWNFNFAERGEPAERIRGMLATSDFFSVLGVQPALGRVFTAGDTTNRPDVIIINETMARRFWPSESPLGKRIGGGNTRNPDWQEIVGVVDDIRFPANLSGPDTRFQAYRPLAQESRQWLTIELRAEGSAEALTTALRRTVAEIDPDLPVFEIETARQRVDQILANGALLGVLLGAFAALGLVLAAVGIYGVISYSVAQRTGEFGIRMALGAQRSDVFRLVLKHGLRLSLLGVLIGFVGALAVIRLLTTAVPEMPSRDPITFAALSLTLMAVALLACWLPARRATQVDPMEALRHE